MRESPSKGRRGEVENERQLSCRNRKRRRDNMEAVDADPDHQQDGNQEAERVARDADGL